MTPLNGGAGLAPPAWGGPDAPTLVCRQVQEITHDVRTFLFAPAEPALFHHEPGQFVTLRVRVDGRDVRRCYTISTPPTRPHLLGITVKRQPGGLVSNWLHDTMAPGRTLHAEGPFGDFTTTRHPSAKYLFLSAGSGITPVMSMTRTLYDLGSAADVVFVHSARTPSDVIFRRELETIASTVPTVRVVPVCERDGPTEAWGGLRGLLTVEMLHLLAPDLAERVVFCCGPAPYRAAVRRMLGEVGFDLRHHHEESFATTDPATDPVPDGPAGDDPADRTPHPATRTHTVEFVRSGRRFPCAEDQNVLDAAHAAGLSPPSSCGQGMCGTCTSTMTTGSVDMRHRGGIRPREIARNRILLCCATPRSDLTIDA